MNERKHKTCVFLLFQKKMFPKLPKNLWSAFNAHMTKDYKYTSKYDVLLFDAVTTNIGNGYHADNGDFIAQETGVYVFTWTTRENGDCLSTTELIVNHEKRGVVPMHSLHYGTPFHATGVVVTRVNAGDSIIYISKTPKYGPCNYKESVTVQLSSFAGWKLS